MYVITDYSRQQARKLGVELRLSSNPKKKIDVYKDGKKIASIGATNFNDYGTYLQTKGKAYADWRRKLYRLRHKGEEKVIGSNGFWSWFLLW